MGVNCSVRLNEGADWRKVGQVASVLLGAEMHTEPLGKDGWHVVVDGFGYGQHRVTGDPAYVDIMVHGDEKNPAAKYIKATDSLPYALWYGLESRSLYPKATAAKIALAEAITRLFGGRIVYNDSTDRKAVFKSPRLSFKGESNASFYRFQNALKDLKPLTLEDVKRCEKHAAYSEAA